MPAPKTDEPCFTSPIHPNNTSSLDMGNCCLRIGVAVPDAKWLTFNRDEWRMLYLLLTRCPAVGVPPVVDSSKALELLADWAKSSYEWMDRHEGE